jgi:hypothetical protein
MIGSERSAGALARLAQLIMQRTLHTFGSGEEAPNIAVLTVSGDVTKSAAVRATLARVSSEFPRFRTSSYFSTGSSAHVSSDRHTAFATFNRRVSRASAHPELEPARCPWAKSERCSIDPTTQKEQKHGKSD